MQKNHSHVALQLIRNLEPVNKEISFEYFITEDGFYVNIVGHRNLCRVTCGGNDYIDLESIDENGNHISYEHIEDLENLNKFTERLNNLLVVANEV